jgi:hypothetical protein
MIVQQAQRYGPLVAAQALRSAKAAKTAAASLRARRSG